MTLVPHREATQIIQWFFHRALPSSTRVMVQAAHRPSTTWPLQTINSHRSQADTDHRLPMTSEPSRSKSGHETNPDRTRHGMQPATSVQFQPCRLASAGCMHTSIAK